VVIVDGQRRSTCISIVFTVSREEFFVEYDVPFGVDAGYGLTLDPFDGADNGVVLEMFIYVATVAGDASGWCPAINVSAKGISWVRK
jgi:hypothetical protein